MTELPDASVDVTLTDPPYPNRMQLFSDAIADGYAALYLACKKTKNYVVFFWSNDKIPTAPPGWYEVARHIWHKPDCKSITHYELIIVWSRDYKRKTSRVWSIPILDYRSLRDWKPHPTQKPVRLLRYVLDLYTKEGDTVLDPFVGTGTTAVACKQLRRHFIAIDNDPECVKMATERLTTKSKQEETADAPTENPDAAEEGAPEPTPEDIEQPLPEDDPDAIIEEPTASTPRPAPRTANLNPRRTHHLTTHPARAAATRAEPEKPRRPPKPTTRAPPARRAAYVKR